MGKLLLFSYAFPPMQTQMTPAATKPMAALSRLGYEVDVLCAAPFSPHLSRDDSLQTYVTDHFRNVLRLYPPEKGIGKLWLESRRFSVIPDLMGVLQGNAFKQLMDMPLEQYDAILTWSPFHSINPVMTKLKKHRRMVRWIAQFSDPWAGNPLESRKIVNFWSRWQEPRAVAAASYIVHSSSYSRDLMVRRYSEAMSGKNSVISHPFDAKLYPQRPKSKNNQITLRYVGTLFGRRSPESLFRALLMLLARRKELQEHLRIEFIGYTPPEMLETTAAKALPPGMVTQVANVSYVESLEKMYDADILLLIEADVKQNLFVPSKLSDYIGANSPIIGITPLGGAEEILADLGYAYARPSDIGGIALAIEKTIDLIIEGNNQSCGNEMSRNAFSGEYVASQFAEIIRQNY